MRLASAALVCALAAVVHGSARGSPPASRLTLPVAVDYNAGGTGEVVSPWAFCDTGRDGAVLARISSQTGSFNAPAWSRDGSRFAFVERRSLRVSPASSWKPTVLVRDLITGPPAWSPDGLRLAFSTDTGIALVNPDGTGLAHLPGGGRWPTWSADGKRIAFALPTGGIGVMQADGSDVRKLTADGANPAWAPDGSRIAFVSKVDQLGNEELFTMLPDGTGRTQLSHYQPAGGVTLVEGPAWSPDSSTIAVWHAVQHSTGKGYYYERSVDLFEVAAGPATSFMLPSPLVFGLPAWRPVAPPSPGDATAFPCAILKTSANANVKGTAADDLIVTGDGNDTIDGRAGNDWIEAAAGDDRIAGGPGRDEIWSGPGRDRERVRDGERDAVHCGDYPRDVVTADPRDVVAGRCATVARR